MHHIALLIETGLASGRSILEGISRFLHEQNQWIIHHRTGALGSLNFSDIADWNVDGIIARINDPALLLHFKKMGVPVIDTLGNITASPYPLVKCDDHKIGQIGAAHFQQSGFQNLAYLGFASERWSRERQQAFTTEANRFNLKTTSLILPSEHPRNSASPRPIDLINHWLQSLSFPVGIMIASDQMGTLLMEACHQQNLAIPEVVSIISVDNDLPFCHLCQPHLSSIEPNHIEVGYQAAHLLQRSLSGEKNLPKLTQIPPVTLHQRASSDATAVNDSALIKALQFIKSNATLGISVDDIAEHAHLSRSVLQRRFRQQLNTSVADRIRKTKIEKASEMLIYTDLPLIDIAIRSGFNYQEYLSYAFKKETGESPAQFRTRHRNFTENHKLRQNP